MAHQIQHPSSLNPWQQYRQACSIFSNTSRAKNFAWYEQGLEQNLQLHIRPDGPSVSSNYFDRKSGQWSPGPKVTEEILRDPEAFEPVVQEILGKAKENKASSIGVILHVADEFATAELNPELDNPGGLAEMKAQAINEPKEILEDASINAEESSFRIVPYAAAGSHVVGTTVTISRQYDAALAVIRKVADDSNFPIITQTVSAPLIALMGLPSMLPNLAEKPFVSILQYPWFTVLAFFNEHADLKLIRTLQHRGLRQAANFRNALFTTSASLEFMDPDLYIVPLGEHVDDELAGNIKQHFPNSTVETLSPPTEAGIPPFCPEFLISSQPAADGDVSSMTFTSFRDEQWATQDFLPMPRSESEIYPEKGEMSLLRITRLVRVFVVILALGGLAYIGLGMWGLMKEPEWSFDPSEASASQAKLGQLNVEQRQINHWSNLLQDRSKGWIVMESFSRMFPEKGQMLVKTFSYTAKPDQAQGQGTVGFVKVWKVSGYARDEAIEYLNSLNTRKGISAHFTKIYEATGSDAYRTDIGNRNITVNVRTRENSSFRPIPFEEVVMSDTTTYPFTFDLTITQRFEATDPMALNVRAAP